MRKLGVLAVVLLSACSQDAPEQAASQPVSPTPAASVEASAKPSEEASPSQSETPAPAAAPDVEGDWEVIETGPMTTEAAIDEADLPDGLKDYLKSALLEEILANEEWAEEFPDCPVEAQITAIHPAEFAVGMVQGCGPDGRMGIFKEDGGEWRDAVLIGNSVPNCTDLADEGVPAEVPVDWDEGFRCQDTEENWRYW